MDPKRAPRPGPGPSPVQRPVAAKGPATSPAVRRGPAIGELLDQLGRDIRQLQIDFERFFNGGLPLPPEELRTRIQGQLRTLRNTKVASVADSFRLNDLEARFNSYNELFNRRVRDLEEGRRLAHRPAVPDAPRYDPRGGIVFGAQADPGAIEALYHGLAAGGGEGPRFDLDSFQTYLSRQAAAIREKTGCSEVLFRLADEDGKLRLKARPVGARPGSST